MHGNARLTPLTRADIARDVLVHGLTLRAAAAARSVSEKSARRWVQRAREEGLSDRLCARSCVPIRQPRRTSPELETQVLKLRRDRRTYAQILMLVPVSKATVSRILRRHGLNRLKSLDPAPPPVVRYERATPGELIHLDIKKLGRFSRPGVRGTGNRADRNEGAGTEALHVAIDDHSRLGFACVLPNEKIPSVLAALHQAVSFHRFHGIVPKAVLTDRGVSYRSHAFADACRHLGLKHLFTRPYRPQTNGKAERFIQTVTREWAYARCYQSSDHRAAFLPHYIFDYNHHRPHSALNQKPPISRSPLCADNVSRHNS
jgi:transposase InsO family protein